MEKINNFFIICATICILIIIIITSTVIQINKHHEEKALYAMENKIKVHAKRCYLENKCVGEVTLEYLYKTKYLEEVVNPVTKEIIDASSTVNFVNNEIILNIK